MKRTALLATVALVAVSPAVAHAAPAKSRTVTATYTGFSGASTPAASFNLNCSGGVGDCFDFATNKGESKVVLTVADSTGTPVGIQVFQGGDFQSVETFCGTVTLDLSPKSANQISVRPVATPDCAALPTSGTIKAVISRKK
jgi:hypothetical protein